MATRIIAFEIEVDGVTRVIDSFEKLESVVGDVSKLFRQSDFGTDTYRALNKELGRLKQLQIDGRAEIRKSARESVIAADSGRRSYEALNAQLVNLRNQYRQLSEAERNAIGGAKLRNEINALDKELKKIDKSIGLYQRNIGAYGQAFKSLGDIVTAGIITGGVTRAIEVAAAAIQDAVLVTADFNRQMGIVKQVSGATAQEWDMLTTLARDLGASTEFTASQVAQLEIEYSKLGFSAKQIEELLPASLNAATVSGESLGRTAEVVGATVRAFGLEASETGRVVDVLAKTFASSALDLSKWDTAVSQVGAVSVATGKEIEEIAALLGVLANSGFDASVASTSLRNIFLETAQEGITLEEALDDVAGAENSLVRAFELFGKRGAAAAVALSRQREEAARLNAVIEDSEGFAKRSAEAIRQDLRGALDSALSAVEALQISFVSTFGDALTNGINNFATLVRLIAGLISGSEEATKQFAALKREFVTFLPLVASFAVALGILNFQLLAAALRALPAYILQTRLAAIASRGFALASAALTVVLNANPFVLAASAIALIIGALTTAYQRSETFRATLSALASVASEFFKIIKESVGGFVTAFTELAKGNFQNAAEAFSKSFVAANPVQLFASEGGRLAKAYAEGYQAELERSGEFAVDATGPGGESIGVDAVSGAAVTATSNTSNVTAEELQRQVEELAKELGEGGEQAGEDLMGGVGEGVDKATVETISKLKKQKQKLKKELAGLDTDSAEFAKVRSELVEVTRRLNELNVTSRNVGDRKVAVGFERLTELQSSLASSIKDAIAAGEPYDDLLASYADVTQRVNDANSEFEQAMESIADKTGPATTSVSALRDAVRLLQTALEESDGTNVEQLTNDLVAAEEKLKAAEDAIERARIRATEPSRTGVLETDIEDALQSIDTREQQRLQSLERLKLAEDDLAQARKQIELETDIEIAEQRLLLYREGSAEAIELERQIAAARQELADLGVEGAVRNSLEAIELQKERRIAAINAIITNEKQAEAEIEAIRTEANLEALRVRLNNEELTERQRLALKNEIAEQEIQLEKDKLDAIKQANILLNQELQDRLEAGLESLETIVNVVENSTEARANREVAAIESRYAREIELAEGNKERITALEEERDKQVEEIERAQFERAKRLQIASALISQAQGIVNILSAPTTIPDPLGRVYKGVQIALLLAQTASQISKISSQSFAGGGFTGSGEGKPDHTGHRPVGVVHEHEYVVPKDVLMSYRGAQLVAQLEMLRRRRARPGASSARGYVDGGLAIAAANPVLPGAGGGAGILTVRAEAEISESSITKIAEAVSNATQQGSRLGIIEGAEDRNRLAERQQLLDNTSSS